MESLPLVFQLSSKIKALLHRPLLAGVLFGCLLVAPALASTDYVDDFSKPSAAWRYGYNVWSSKPKPLTFGRANRDVTLSPTIIHPQNLDTFSVDVRFQFGEVGKPTLVLGWGKPYDWDEFRACWGKLFVEQSGKFRIDVEGKMLGSGSLTPSPEGGFAVHLEVAKDGITVGDQKFPLLPAQTPRSGFLMFHLDGPDPGNYTPMCSVTQFKLGAQGDHPVMSEQEWRANCDEWARVHIRDNEKVLDALAAAAAKEKAAGKWMEASALQVQPQLVRKGEPVTLTFRALGTPPAQSEAWVVPDYLGAQPGEKRTLALKWKPSASDATVQEAVVKLVPERPGNWYVGWKAGEETLSRVLGVVDEGYAVYRFQFTTQPTLWEPERLPKDLDGKPYPSPQAFDVIHQYGLAADFWCGEWKYGRYFVFPPEETIRYSSVLRKIGHLWGDTASPMCNGDWILPTSPDRNLSRVPPDVQREGIRQVKKCWEILGLGSLALLDMYTQGSATPGIARELGVKALDSMCQWQNWLDGEIGNGWLINDCGAPIFPYYVAADDFRKVASGKSIVQLPQGTTSAVRLFTVMALEGCPKNIFICSDNPYQPTMKGRGAQSKNIDRFKTAVDTWTHEATYQKEPLFLAISLENFQERADWNLANCLAVEHLREQARTHKIVFTQGEGIADYFYNHYERQPENWIYWPDIYAGLAEDFKPDLLADHMELCNAEFHSDHWDGNALPRFYWDYTKPWSSPAWDEAEGLRDPKIRLIEPSKITAANFHPKMEDLTGVSAKVDLKTISANEIQVTVAIDSPKAYAFLPVAAWHIPLSGRGLEVKAPKTGRFVPMIDGSTDNLSGVAVCRDVKAGHGEWTFLLKGQARPFQDPQITIGNSVLGRLFMRDGVPQAYLWLAKEAANCRLSINVPQGRKVSVHYNDGTTEEAADGKIEVRMSHGWPNQSPMVTGLSCQELHEQAKVIPFP